MTTAPAEWSDDVRVLARALDQTGDVLDHVHPDQLTGPTPCPEWDVAALVDHVISAPRRFLTMMRGEEPDWSAPPEHVVESWGPTFRVAGDDLIHAWHERSGAAPVPADWQSAELAIHTWDLATAIGFPLEGLDPEVAARGLAFLQANLTEDNRSPVFAPEQAAPEGAGPYDRVAAYAGRTVAD
jgi:uncharacterized protein (TIGR03086 family)